MKKKNKKKRYKSEEQNAVKYNKVKVKKEKKKKRQNVGEKVNKSEKNQRFRKRINLDFPSDIPLLINIFSPLEETIQ